MAAKAPTKASVSTKVPTTSTATTKEAQAIPWTVCISPVQNEGQCGDCWAFATASAVEFAHCIAGGQKSLNKFSEQQLVSCTTQNNGCNGGAPQYTFDSKSLKQRQDGQLQATSAIVQ